MERNELVRVEAHTPARVSEVMDLAEVGRRWRYRMMGVFVATMACAIIATLFIREYESEMKILLKRERLDLSASEQTVPDARQNPGEEEMNTEAELLRSDDVLRSIVQQLHMQEKASEPLWMRLFGGRTGSLEEIRMAKAVAQLNANLDIILPKKSNIISVRYHSSDPRLATQVLNALSRFYIEKHMAVRRPPEQFKFFADQVQGYREQLVQAEARLVSFPRKAGTAAGQMELELTEGRLGDLRLEFHQTQAAIEEAQKRIANLQTQLASAQPRITTVVRRADNEYLMMQVKTTLLTLEMKRTELLKKYEPSYREVQQVDREIAQTRAAIELAEKSPLHDETSDRDATYEWIKSELAKARADLNAYQAKATSLGASIVAHEQEARRLNEKSLQQKDLQRDAKTAEDSYQLYLRKREEARISDALDQSKFLNVAIAQRPTAPVLPRRSPWVFLLGGVIVAIVLSAGTGLVSERLDDSLRSPAEIEGYLDLAVLAVLPASEMRQLSRE